MQIDRRDRKQIEISTACKWKIATKTENWCKSTVTRNETKSQDMQMCIRRENRQNCLLLDQERIRRVCNERSATA